MTGLAAVAILLLVATVVGIIASRQAHRDIARLNEEAHRSGRALRLEEYARELKQAGRAWEDNHLDLTREMLDRHHPPAGREDLRGFAWDYLHRLCQIGRPPLRGHEGEVDYATFSPDGTILATASGDRTARLWDPEAGVTRIVLRGHAHDLNWISISPDGSTVATASEDQAVNLRSLSTGLIKRTLSGREDEVVVVIFSPDGRRLISCGRKGEGHRLGHRHLRGARPIRSGQREPPGDVDLPRWLDARHRGRATILWGLAQAKELARLERRQGQTR